MVTDSNGCGLEESLERSNPVTKTALLYTIVGVPLKMDAIDIIRKPFTDLSNPKH